MNRILEQVTPETAAKIAEQAAGLSIDEYLRTLLGLTQVNTGTLDVSLDEFEADLNALSDGTENLSPSTLTYSREDIYFDHD